MLGAMRPEIREIGGTLDLSLRAFGTLAAPAFLGDGAVHRGHVLLRDRPEALHDIEARLVFSTQGVQVRDATAAMGGGRLQAQGDIALQGWQPAAYRFKLQAKDVAVGQIEGFSSAWDADVELSGITREAQLTGRARLVRGAYRRDLSVLSLVLAPAQAAAVDPGTPLRGSRASRRAVRLPRARSPSLTAGSALQPLQPRLQRRDPLGRCVRGALAQPHAPGRVVRVGADRGQHPPLQFLRRRAARAAEDPLSVVLEHGPVAGVGGEVVGEPRAGSQDGQQPRP